MHTFIENYTPHWKSNWILTSEMTTQMIDKVLFVSVKQHKACRVPDCKGKLPVVVRNQFKEADC